jgi:hypothetical protein
LWTVEENHDVRYTPTAPEAVIKALIAAVGTGTELRWQDRALKDSNGLLHATEYFWLRFQAVKKERNWRVVEEQPEGTCFFITVDNPGFQRRYNGVTALEKAENGFVFIPVENGRGPQDRRARLLRRTREEIVDIIKEKSREAVEDMTTNLYPEIVVLTKFQQRKRNVKLVLIAKSHHVFNRWLELVKAAAEKENTSGLTILLQERIDEDSPPILKWADPIQQWNTLRPLINWVEKRTMPPCPKEEENVWFFLYNAAMGMT